MYTGPTINTARYPALTGQSGKDVQIGVFLPRAGPSQSACTACRALSECTRRAGYANNKLFQKKGKK